MCNTLEKLSLYFASETKVCPGEVGLQEDDAVSIPLCWQTATGAVSILLAAPITGTVKTVYSLDTRVLNQIVEQVRSERSSATSEHDRIYSGMTAARSRGYLGYHGP